MRIVWTAPALLDLASARDYIARANPRVTDRQIQRVLSAVESLIRFPEVGRPGRRIGTRELVVGQTPYLVPYRLNDEVIEILRVLHGRQRWPEAL